MDDDLDLFTTLHDVARLVRVEADRRARVHGMTLVQWKSLTLLRRHPGLNQKELADLLEVEPISVARLIDRLETSGLVERRRDAEDRRVWRLHLRPGADAALQKIQLLRVELTDVVTRGVGPEMRETVLLALRRMKANLSQAAIVCSLDMKESA